MDFLRLLWTGQARASEAESATMRALILHELQRKDVVVERTFV